VGGGFRENGPQYARLRPSEERARDLRVPWRASSTSVEPIQKGIFVATAPASVGSTASRRHRIPGFGSGYGEARRESLACAPSPVTARRPGRRLRPTTRPAQSHIGVGVPNRTGASANVRFSASRPRLEQPGFAATEGSPQRGIEGSATHLRACGPTTGSAVERYELLGDFAPHRNRVDRLFREWRLAAAVILWSGAQGQGRSNADGACTRSAQLEDRKTSRLNPVTHCGKTARRESSTNTALRSSGTISEAQANHTRGTEQAGDSQLGAA
jgi:hypothetical protein